MTDASTSEDRRHAAGLQRKRRAHLARIDFYPNAEAFALIESRRTRYCPTNNYSGILNTIIAEWAEFVGLKQTEVAKPVTPAKPPELWEQYARMRITSVAVNTTRMRGTSDDLAECAGAIPAPPELPDASQARACANDFDPRHPKSVPPPAIAAPEFIATFARANESEFCHATRAGAHVNNSGSPPAGANQARVICGAKRRRDGQPCQGLSIPGKRRCKWHGGASTGPRTHAGRERSLANLRQYGGRIEEACSTSDPSV